MKIKKKSESCSGTLLRSLLRNSNLLVFLSVMQGLVKSIAWDSEGATCFIEVQVSGAGTEAEAAKIARSVASSSLTKAKLLKACGTLLETLIEIRKASSKWVDKSAHYELKSLTTSAFIDKLKLNEPIVESSTPVKTF